ncbi:MAG: MBOAT family O-acyltransferase [Verrucomicrobiota bacterium]
MFLFLPVVLAVCALPGLKLRNALLLVFSVIFYAWGEVLFVFLMLGSALLNYFLGRWVDRETGVTRRKWAVGVAVALNIGTLAFFKYANFMVGNLNLLLGVFHLGAVRMVPVRLPIGISFFTFHALSYVIDVYRRKWASAKTPCDVALYIFFFPQLIAGPILRWSAIAPQLARRAVSREGFAEGVRRFVGGLAKKMIVANVMAAPADKLFGLSGRELTPSLAWLAVGCYTLQIYFDFSGYSDMAVGLGKMFGFQFIENFNFPYTAQSIRAFWRRWHISLSSWFRDYLYIPMGGNRCPVWRNHLNLVIVFFLCGLWHGASWTFVIWGLYHGIFLVIERTRFGQWIDGLPRPLRHGYALVVVMAGWVLFRADSFGQAVTMLGNLVGVTGGVDPNQKVARYWNAELACSIGCGVLFAMPAWEWILDRARAVRRLLPGMTGTVAETAGLGLELLLVVALLLISAAWLAGGTYNPFIYFRF